MFQNPNQFRLECKRTLALHLDFKVSTTRLARLEYIRISDYSSL